VTHDGVGCLLLPADVRSLLGEAGIGVRRPHSARSMRRGERQRRQQRGASRVAQPHRRRYQRRPIPNRRKDPHGWAMAMLGRMGGLRSQQSYRARGVHPTAKATQDRIVKRGQRVQPPTTEPAAHLTATSTTKLRTAADVYVFPPRGPR
jgi:hypothetical protein